MKVLSKENIHLVFCALIFIYLWLTLPLGVYMGGDWTLPVTLSQYAKFLHPYTWSTSSNFGEPSLISLVGLPYRFILSLIAINEATIQYCSKVLIIFIFEITFYFTYKYLRYININPYVSVTVAVLYISTPTFFNYIPMGWVYALISMGLFPLGAMLFTRAIDNSSIKDVVLFSLVWAVATMQSQAIIWFPLIMICILMQFFLRNMTKEALKFAIYAVLIYLSISLYWIMPFLIFGDENISNNQILNASSSLGADSVFNSLNAIRLWGGLFNQQFETILITSGLQYYSWLLPIFFILSYVTTKKNREIILSYSIIAIILTLAILFLRENRSILFTIPGAGLIRHLGRFLTIISFAYLIVLAVFFDNLISNKIKTKFKLFILILIMIGIGVNIYPLYSNKLIGKSNLLTTKDIRLRVKIFPRDYYELENLLSSFNDESKALYLPYGMAGSYLEDPEFNGIFKEAIDPFAAFSPIPGQFVPSERPSPIIEFLDFIENETNLVIGVSKAPINYFILRKNIEPGAAYKYIKNQDLYFPDDQFVKLFESNNINLYKSKDYLPIIYKPISNIVVNSTIEDIMKDQTINKNRGASFTLKYQNLKKFNYIFEYGKSIVNNGSIEYKKNTPASYTIIIKNVNKDFPIIFGEGYSEGWKLIQVKSEENNIEKKIYDKNNMNEYYNSRLNNSINSKNNFQNILLGGNEVSGHFKINGFANAWLINVENLCKFNCQKNSDGSYNIKLELYFYPQIIFIVALIISIINMIGFFSFAIYYDNKKKNI